MAPYSKPVFQSLVSLLLLPDVSRFKHQASLRDNRINGLLFILNIEHTFCSAHKFFALTNSTQCTHTHVHTRCTCTYSNNNQCAITCSSRAASGYLYPLDKGFIFVHKPAVYIKFDGIASVNFARMTGGAGVSKSFDFEVELKDGNVHHFSSMMK